MATELETLISREDPALVERARKKADAMLLELRIADIRKLAEMTQREMADALGVKQPTIAGLEKGGQDVRLSSIKRYVEAIGGKVSLTIELADGSQHDFPV
ncbi:MULTISPECIES: helix-turn-helix domain-containing protein [unclassified Halomonas]|uniref:helix-turn-helix domain-containing protein n=1 Tax=unclassified Halomonas TaxID=2609666 RepID=UPI000C8C9E52|nr:MULTISPECIES: helix-turn-helix domain-containing protein [unclassified Halomonas]MAR71623.1 transcriptional regulator [Halomonas sp.]MBR9881318.1 helix-turn-helix transcriptional regulator [Gammaproteobacteria bacterium]|tara:strand:- start:308 stop:610 length:303 start_codon:yes stop_codon:yes gene_type:complete